MRKLFTILACLIMFQIRGQGFEWKNQTLGSGIVKDKQNNLIALAQSSTTITITKYNSQGTLINSKLLNGGGTLTAWQVDKNNNLVIVGNITQPTIFETYSLIPVGSKSFYIVTLSPSLSVINAKVYGSKSEAYVNDIFITDKNELLIGGGFKDTIKINNSFIEGSIYCNFFIAKFDSLYNLKWAEKGTYNNNPGELAQVDEIAQTASGKYYFILTMMSGLVVYHGYEFENSGIYIVQLDSARNMTWTDYVGYPDLQILFSKDLQTNGDTAYLKICDAGHNNHAWLLMWDQVGVQKMLSLPC